MSLLGKFKKCLKSQNLVSGFRACGIFPLDWHEVLKRLQSANATDDFNEFSFNDSLLEFLKMNCGITSKKKRKQTKQGKKLIPSKRVLNASELEEGNDENVRKKGGAKKSESIDTDDEDIWRCRECGDEWNNNSSDRSIVCSTSNVLV